MMVDDATRHHFAAPLFSPDRSPEERGRFTTCGPRTRSRDDVAERVSLLARALVSELRVAPGDRVAILASPPRVSDDEEGGEEGRRTRSLLGDRPSTSTSTTSRPLFPADDVLEALLATTAAGCVAAPLNGRLPPEETLAEMIRSLEPKALFSPRGRRGCARVVSRCLERVAAGRRGAGGAEEDPSGSFGLPRGPELPVVVWLDDDDDDDDDGDGDGDGSRPPPPSFPFPQVSLSVLLRRATGRANAPLALRCAPGDAAAVVFTSGTSSGEPRGALLSHSSLFFQSEVKVKKMTLCESDSCLHAAPLFHVAGLSALGASLVGRCERNVLLEAGGWTRGGGWRAAVEGEVTALSAVSAMAFDLARENARRSGREEGEGKRSKGAPPPLSSVRVVVVGGGPPPASTVLSAAFPSEGVRILTAYGLTEGCSSVLWGEARKGDSTSSSSSFSTSSSFSSGAGGGVDVAVAVFGDGSDPSSWRLARDGEEGELLTRGPHVFLGYWRDEKATRAALLPPTASTAATAERESGSDARLPWLRTGDFAASVAASPNSDARRIKILGRGSDAIRVGAETVHLSSVEASLARALSLSPPSSSTSRPSKDGNKSGISALACVGLPHPRLGRVVAALVSLEDGVGWRGDVVVDESDSPPPPTAGCGVPLSLSTLRQAGRSAGLPGHALPRRAAAMWGRALPTKGPLDKLDRGEVLRLVARAVAASGGEDDGGEERRARL